MIRVPAPVRMRVHHDQLNREEMMMSSPMRLGSGGKARLARLAVNHHIVISGRTI